MLVMRMGLTLAIKYMYTCGELKEYCHNSSLCHAGMQLCERGQLLESGAHLILKVILPMTIDRKKGQVPPPSPVVWPIAILGVQHGALFLVLYTL